VTTPDRERQQREQAQRNEYEDEPRVIRDKRRIDPVTGAVRPQGSGPAPGGAGGGPSAVPEPGRAPAGEAAAPDATEVESLRTQVAERTVDLQRVQAEYANYRKRVERDREAVRDLAVAGVLGEMLSVLDDIGRAREHGELEGGFKSVAESLEAVVAKLGLERYGEPGEVFDPNVHEALMHAGAADVTEPTCVQVMQPGYRLGERVIRPARVAVAEPADPSDRAVSSQAGDAEPSPRPEE